MNKLIAIENNTIFEKYYCSQKVLTGWDIGKIHSIEIKKVMENAYGINISRKSLNSFCEKFQLKTNDYGYVYYNPDKKSADFRFYMEIADKLLKCLCNYPYTRKKYNLSLSFYNEHSKKH